MNIQKFVAGKQGAQSRTYSFGGFSNKRYPFPVMFIGNFLEGTYPIRFLWADQVKNPHGMYRLVTHRIYQGPNTKSIQFLAVDELESKSESYGGVYDVLDLIEQHGVYEKLKPRAEFGEVCKGIEQLSPWPRYWIPVLIGAKTQPTPPGQEPDAYPKYIPDPTFGTASNPTGLDVVLEVNCDVKLIQDIIACFQQYPTMDSPTDGYDCRLTIAANKRYSLAMGVQRALPRETQEFVSKNYPDMPAAAKNMFLKKTPPAVVVNSLRSTTWAQSLYAATKGVIAFPDPVVPTIDLGLGEDVSAGGGELDLSSLRTNAPSTNQIDQGDPFDADGVITTPIQPYTPPQPPKRILPPPPPSVRGV